MDDDPGPRWADPDRSLDPELSNGPWSAEIAQREPNVEPGEVPYGHRHQPRS